jgi:hypothetical protein
MSADYSRTELLAATATAVSGDLLTHLGQQVVIVSCDPKPDTVRAARILLTTLRRLPIVLAFDARNIAKDDVAAIADAVTAVYPERPLQAEPREGLRVHIGVHAPEGILRVIPSQHGAHVVRDGRTIDAVPASPLGSSMAAAFAVAEVFKAIVRVRAERRADVAHYAFCPVTLTDRPEAAPALPLPFHFSGALVGLGAIGSATAMILGEMETEGDIDLVDRQVYANENVTTYSLGGHVDAFAGVWKTELAERALRRATCRRFDNGIEDYVARVEDGSVAPTRIVLAGLDSPEARHETQRLWPDLLIDGATGDTMLGLHVVLNAGQPCMRCFVKVPAVTESPYARLSELTGLPVEKLREGDTVLREDDLAGVSAEQRERLAAHVGKKICGLAQVVGLTDLSSEGFRPSAAFVSLAAACLVVGRVVGAELNVAPEENFVQYDALFGPGRATIDVRRADLQCYCVQRNAVIERVRERRFSETV